MNKFENAILFFAGKIIMAVAVAGVGMAIKFDLIARGMEVTTWGWLQACGVAAFALLALFGVGVDLFLNEHIKPMIEKYLQE